MIKILGESVFVWDLAIRPRARCISLDCSLISYIDLLVMLTLSIACVLIDADSARLLHGYCDSDSAPYADAHLLFTLDIGDLNPLVPHKQTLVSERLRPIWSQLPDYEFSPLMTRISSNVVYIEHEQSLPTKCV